MVWQVNFTDQAKRDIKRLDSTRSQEILRYLRERIATDEDPERFGKALTGQLLGLWRYRIGDYRAICQIDRLAKVVLVLRVAHRKEVYE